MGLAFILLGGFSLIGCAGKSAIELQYEPTGINLEPCPGSIAVVELADKRPQSAIGKTKDGKEFYSKTSVPEWVSRALYDELVGGGCQAEYHEKAYEFDTDFTLTGDIVEIFVTQKSLSDYSASMKLRIVATAGGSKVYEKTYTSTLGKTTVPSPGVNTKVLTELLQGMMRELVPDVRDRLRK
jgi:hypothetical protein